VPLLQALAERFLHFQGAKPMIDYPTAVIQYPDHCSKGLKLASWRNRLGLSYVMGVIRG
jgi:hypothetical protein